MPTSSAKHTALHLLVLAVLAALVYAHTFSVPFQFDDAPNIRDNPIVKDLAYFAHPDRASTFTRYDALRMRYMGFLTFALDYRLHGLDVTGYHVVNFAIHLLNIFLLYALVMLSFRTPLLSDTPMTARARWVALLAAALFAVHPVNTQAVTYIVQRLASMTALCYLGAMVCYIKARLSGRKLAGLAYYLACLMLAVVAIKTKENAFTLPLAVALYEVCLFPGGGFRKRVLLLPLLLTMLIIPLGLLHLDMPAAQMFSNVSDRATLQHISRWTYLLTEPRVMTTYLRLLVFPINQTLDYDYPLYSSLAQGPVLLSLALIALLFWLAARLYRRGGPTGRLAAFGIVFFFLALSVESTLVPLAPIFEHRLYLPMTGMALAVSVGAVWLYDTLGTMRARQVLVALCVSAIAVLSIQAAVRNEVWRTPYSLWKDVAIKAPGNVRALNNVSALYRERGRFEKSRDLLHKALKRNPYFPETYCNLGLLDQRQGKYEKAIAMFKEALALKPAYPEALIAIGASFDKTGNYHEAVRYYTLAIQLKPDYHEAYVDLGASLGLQGKYREAEEALQKAITLNPDSPDAYNNLADVHFVRGELDQAVSLFQRSLALNPAGISPRVNLLKIYIKRSEFAKARKEYEALEKIAPAEAAPYKALIP